MIEITAGRAEFRRLLNTWIAYSAVFTIVFWSLLFGVLILISILG